MVNKHFVNSLFLPTKCAPRQNTFAAAAVRLGAFSFFESQSMAPTQLHPHDFAAWCNDDSKASTKGLINFNCLQDLKQISFNSTTMDPAMDDSEECNEVSAVRVFLEELSEDGDDHGGMAMLDSEVLSRPYPETAGGI